MTLKRPNLIAFNIISLLILLTEGMFLIFIENSFKGFVPIAISFFPLSIILHYSDME